MTLTTHNTLVYITDIGDSACLIAVVVASSIYLLCRKSGRAAAFLMAALILSAVTVALLKVIFMGCESTLHRLGIHSPSGHTACSAAVFWAFAMLMRSQLPENRRFLPLVLLSIPVAAIAVSRVLLDYHTTAEVIVGLCAGMIGILLARIIVLRKGTVGSFDAYALALWGVAAVLLIHGAHLPVEQILQRMAFHLRGYIPLCAS